jgi:hypothetical protein
MNYTTNTFYGAKRSATTCLVFVLSLIVLATITVTGQYSVYGVEVIPKDEPPLGTPYDVWVAKYWNWVISLSTEEATPKNDGCLINKADSMVMLMQTTFGGTHNQVCNISSTNAIMIPLWVGWCDTGG